MFFTHNEPSHTPGSLNSMSNALKYFSKPLASAPHIVLPLTELDIRGLTFP